MEELKKQMDFVLDGFFYFFGFTENPAADEVKEIMKDSPADKIKADIKRVNKDFRNKFVELRKQALCLE